MPLPPQSARRRKDGDGANNHSAPAPSSKRTSRTGAPLSTSPSASAVRSNGTSTAGVARQSSSLTEAPARPARTGKNVGASRRSPNGNADARSVSSAGSRRSSVIALSGRATPEAAASKTETSQSNSAGEGVGRWLSASTGGQIERSSSAEELASMEAPRVSSYTTESDTGSLSDEAVSFEDAEEIDLGSNNASTTSLTDVRGADAEGVPRPLGGKESTNALAEIVGDARRDSSSTNSSSTFGNLSLSQTVVITPATTVEDDSADVSSALKVDTDPRTLDPQPSVPRRLSSTSSERSLPVIPEARVQVQPYDAEVRAEAAAMRTPTLSNSFSDSRPSEAPKRSFWGMLRAPSSPISIPNEESSRHRSVSLSSTGAGPSNSPMTSASNESSLRRPSFSPLSSLSTFASSLTPTRAISASLAVPEEQPRMRLPRRNVDEDQLADETMRFASAKHEIRVECDIESLRRLAGMLEEGWREKLAEVTELRATLEEMQDNAEDLEDENNHLRGQMQLLAETIANQGAEFERFQLTTVEQQARERELWEEEAREDSENARLARAEAHKEVAEEKAINAQLRLVLSHALSGRVDSLQGLGRALTGGMPGNNRKNRSSISSHLARDRTPSDALSSAPSIEFSQDVDLDEDPLFTMPTSPSEENRFPNALFTSALSVSQLRDMGLVSGGEDDAIGNAGGFASPRSPMSLERLSTPSPSTSPTGLRSLSHSSSASRFAADKKEADQVLENAIREENQALRRLADERERKAEAMQEELDTLRNQLRATEEAVSGLFDDV